MAYRASDQDREAVALMVGYGIPLDEIRRVVINPATGKAIGLQTLRRHFKTEIEQGRAKANAQVVRSLFLLATGKREVVVDGKVVEKERASSPMAAIWWTKARMGWNARGEQEDGVTKPAKARASESQDGESKGKAKGKDNDKADPGKVVIYLPDNGRDPAAAGAAGKLSRQPG